MSIGKTGLLVFVIACFAVSVSAESAVQATGMQEKITADVNRSDYSFTQRLSIYCRYYELDSCENGFSMLSIPGTLHHYFTVEDPEQWYENREKAENEGSESSTDTVEVQRFS